MKGQLLLVGACGAGILFMLVNLGRQVPVTVSCCDPTVNQQFFDPSRPPADINPNENAKTTWKFNESSDFHYDFVEKQQIGDRWMVRIKPVSVTVGLSLDILELLPRGASAKLKEHEKGHVTICKQIYDGAGDKAREAAGSVLGQTYSGEGATLDAACAQAIADARAEMDDLYRSSTVRVVNDVSEIYDYLQLDKKAAPSRSVVKAFADYRKGRPRHLSEG